MAHAPYRERKTRSPLRDLMNVGPATVRDLERLGIKTVEQLRHMSPDALYAALERETGKKQDPCVRDVFAAIIHEAQTGEKHPWWRWSRIRRAASESQESGKG